MDSISAILQMLLSFLLQLLTLMVHFFIAVLNLVLSYSRTLVREYARLERAVAGFILMR